MKILRDIFLQFLLTILSLVVLIIAASLMNLFSKNLAAAFAGAVALGNVFMVWKRPEKAWHIGRVGGSVVAVVAGLLGLVLFIAPDPAERLAALRKSDPVAYLADIEKSDPALWMKELEVLDPPKFKAETERLAQEVADKAKADDAARVAEARAAEAGRLAEQKAAEEKRVADQQAAIAALAAQAVERGKKFADLKTSILSNVELEAWYQLGRQIEFAQISFKDELAEARPDLEAAILAATKQLPAADLEGNKDAYEILANLNPDKPEYQSKAKDYTAKLEAARLLPLKKMIRKEDKVEGVTWFKHPNQPKYTNTRSTVFLYIGQRSGQRPFLRMVVQYTASDWLFVDQVYAWHKEAALPNGMKELLITGPFERDNNSTIWEWLDVTPDEGQLAILRSMAGSSESILRFVGAQYTKDVTLSAKDKTAINDVLDAFDALNHP